MTNSNQPQYSIWMLPDVHEARKRLPGKIRQRIKRAIEALGSTPNPPSSIPLQLLEANIQEEWEVRRIRIDEWRIV